VNCRFCQYLKLNQIPVHSQLSSPYPSWSTLISSQVLSTINKHLEHFIHISHYITSVPGNLSVITYLTLYFNLTLYRHFIHLSHYTHTHITYLISHRFFYSVIATLATFDREQTARMQRWSLRARLGCSRCKTPGGSVASKGSPTNWIPSGYVKIAIENGHKNSEFSH